MLLAVVAKARPGETAALAQGRAFGQPHGQALADFFGEHKQFKFFAQFSMIPFFGFFQKKQILGQFLCFWKGDPI